MAVLLAKPRSTLEVVNDFDSELINFYRCVRFHRDALFDELEFVLNSRQEFDDFRRELGLTDLQRASRWFHRNKICFGGADMSSFGTGALAGGASHGSRANRMESIRALNQRLDRACIEHLDWERCIKKYDRPTTFFFCDPPYTACADGIYAAWTDADVQRFRECLATLKGKWLVTLNDTPAIRAIFEGCQIHPFSRVLGINNRGEGPAKQYHELIIAPTDA